MSVVSEAKVVFVSTAAVIGCVVLDSVTAIVVGLIVVVDVTSAVVATIVPGFEVAVDIGAKLKVVGGVVSKVLVCPTTVVVSGKVVFAASGVELDSACEDVGGVAVEPKSVVASRVLRSSIVVVVP